MIMPRKSKVSLADPAPVPAPIVDKEMLKQLLDEEFSKGVFEWKVLKMDKTLTLKMLNELGKEGWKFAFVLDTSVWKKDGISEIYMQRLLTFTKKGGKQT